MKAGAQRIVVERARHAWPVGYFDDLIGQRIPFTAGGIPHGRPLSGLLMTVTETESHIECWFDEVERDALDGDEERA